MDRTAVITGATNGVGRVVAERLGRDGWFVAVHGRDHARGTELVQRIEGAGGRARFYKADLSSLATVRELAKALAADHPHIPLLINNAGIGFGRPRSGRETSADGFELRLAVNYLAPFLLTQLLLPNVLAAAPARIVNVASAGQLDVDFDDLQLTRHYDGITAYRRSKLALILFTFDLARQLHGRGVTVNALHPATFMDTFMVREAGGAPMSSVDEGADAIMNLATGPAVAELSGEYFDGMRRLRARPQAYDESAQARLRALSFELTGAPPCPR